MSYHQEILRSKIQGIIIFKLLAIHIYINDHQLTQIPINGKINQKKETNQTMKATGVVRKVDRLGRIIIPIEIRDIFDIKIKDGLESFTEGKFSF